MIEFCGSRALLNSCDLHTSNPKSSFPLVDKDIDFTSIKRNQTVYINNSAITNFVIQYLPTIKCDFILVSGDSDITYPTDMNQKVLNLLLRNKHLKRWWCQNWIGNHPKVITLPIGLDYHTIAENENHSWGNKKSEIAQEKELLDMKCVPAWSPYSQRLTKCYSNFTFAMNTRFSFDRRDCISKCNTDLVFYEPNPISRNESWTNQREYAFVLSPMGGGIDCHRLWEALHLGCIPIVKSTKGFLNQRGLDSMYNDLPVLIVDDWTDITNTLLEDTLHKFQKMDFNLNKLRLDYWVKQIKNSWKPSVYILGTARNCGIHLQNVIDNIQDIREMFSLSDTTVFYDCSDDDTLTILKKNPVKVICNNEPLLPLRTARISNARNKLLESIELKDKRDYFIMMDMDNVNSGNMNLQVLKDGLRDSDNWDGLTFNRPNYYDIFALCYDKYVYNCWSYGNKSQLVVEEIKKDITNRLDNCSGYLRVKSAFNGFGIYKLDKYISLRYSSKRLPLPNLLPYPTYDIEDNCEHCHFHLQGAKRGRWLLISKQHLFTDICSD